MPSEAADFSPGPGAQAGSRAAVIEAAPAKVNLFLEISGRRADGFHDLTSLVAFADLGERVEVRPGAGLSLAVDGPFAADAPGGSENLVLRAARALQAHTGCETGAAMVLSKTLPVAAGLGGGSADAAAALRALQRFWNAGVSEPALFDLALKLGSDVPVCLGGRSAILTGRGETLAPCPVPPCPAVLVNPGVRLDTADVFAGLGDTAPTLPPFPLVADQDALIGMLHGRRNDLEAPALALAPDIAAVLAALCAQSGCRLARMSGSGATCFALFDESRAAAAAARRIAGVRPGWWVADTVIGTTERRR